MDEFKRQGGNLTGREERTDAFGGEPRAVGGTLGGAGAKGTTSLTENDTARNGHHTKEHLGTTGTSTTGSHTTSHDTTGKKPSLMDKLNPKIDADGDGKAGFMK
jgi:hypothetical protein